MPRQTMNDVPSVDELSRQVYREFANQPQQLAHVAAHPVCEVCGRAPSVRINHWGPIKACCEGCLVKEQQDFDAYCAEDERIRKELGDAEE